MSHTNQFQHLKIQLDAIQSATNNFSADSVIGYGGFGKVYKGELVHSKGKTMVALKRLDRKWGQGDPEFWKEIMMLSLYKHENIVSLLGYCDDHGEKILVYEYLAKKSLDCYLASNDLKWTQRLKICVGAARGLLYLHSPAETQLRIVHRDIKSSNILLDNNWNAKISDFGLSKFAPANKIFTYMVSNPVGTRGYVDPLYDETGLLTKESDVYSFGVVLFEVLCGRLCFCNKNTQPLIGLVREYYEQNKISELVYGNIKDEINISSLKLFVDIAYRCLSRERKERPLMIEIVNALVMALNIQEKADGKVAIDGVGILNVKLLGIREYGEKNPSDVSNDYLILDLSHTSDDPQRVKVEGNEVFTLYVEKYFEQHLNIVVNKVESVNKHRYVGNASMKLRDVTPEIPQTFNLSMWDEPVWDEKYVGDLKVEVLYKCLAYHDHIPTISRSVQKAPIGTPKDGGLLLVIIHSASSMRRAHRHTSIKLCIHGELRNTPSMMNTWTPTWLQEFTFMLEQPPTNEKLHLEVINNDPWIGSISSDFLSDQLYTKKESLGCTDISLADVVERKQTYEICEIFRLASRVGGFDHTRLTLELRWITSN